MSYTKLYLYVPTEEISKKVQKILFKLGCWWFQGENNIIRYTKSKYLVIAANGELLYNSDIKNVKWRLQEDNTSIEIDCSWMENYEPN